MVDYDIIKDITIGEYRTVDMGGFEDSSAIATSCGGGGGTSSSR